MTKMWDEIFEQPSIIKRCANRNISKIHKIISEIKNSNINNVVIAARGTSGHAGVYAKYLIEINLGLPVSLAAPSVCTLYNSSLKLDKSLVIGISQSGKAADVCEIIKSAKASGALTISITNSIDSPLARESEYHLYCDAGLEKSVAATKTFTAQIFLISKLVAEWSEDQEMKKELDLIPDKIAQTLDLAEQIKAKAERFRFMNECFILARGINYSIALETALKIQETSYVRARAYAASDFYHGPLAMVEKGMPVFLLVPEGQSKNYMLEMMKKLKEREAEITVFSNVKEAIAMGDVSFEIPSAEKEYITAFPLAVSAQLFACSLSLVKSLNPDSPRGLNKITITK